MIPHPAERELFRALLDVRSAVNSLVVDWMARPDESRYLATKRTFPALRARYPHLSAGWCMSMASETVAVLNAWDRSLRRVQRSDPERFERMLRSRPRRKRLKASLPSSLYVLRDGHLRITLHPDRHVDVDLSEVRNPLFGRYGSASGWRFGLTVTADRLLFHFRVPHDLRPGAGAAGMDLNFGNAVVACSDGTARAFDLTPVLQIQDRMARKRESIARSLSKDQRHQNAVLRRYGLRERRRTDAQLHRITNAIVRAVGDRGLAVEDLTDLAQESLRREVRSSRGRARLSRWTHGRLVTMLGYKLHTPMARVNPEGTSQECPRCGGRTALPRDEEAMGAMAGRRRSRMPRRTVCVDCGSEWHRDVAAAIVVLTRGCPSLRGATVPPSARDALLEAAGWRPEDQNLRGLTAEPWNGADAKPDPPPMG